VLSVRAIAESNTCRANTAARVSERMTRTKEARNNARGVTSWDHHSSGIFDLFFVFVFVFLISFSSSGLGLVISKRLVEAVSALLRL
jgi:hypothetical protein